MAWTSLKTAIASVIKTNGNEEITGALLQSTLNSIVDQVGANASFKGLALPTTSPSTPDGPEFYIAIKAGTYSNFTGETLREGFHVFRYNDGWVRSTMFVNNPRIDFFQANSFTETSYVDWALLFNDIDSELTNPDLIIPGWYEIINLGYHTSSGHDGISVQFVQPDGTRSTGINGYDSDDNGVITIVDSVRGVDLIFTIDTVNFPAVWDTVPEGVLKISSNNVFSKGSKQLVSDVYTALNTAIAAQSTADGAATAAAAAQSTADGAATAAATAQSTADGAATAAATAQSTADGAATAAATAQSTADGAVTDAAAAQSTADGATTAAATAQSTADGAVTAAATAQSTADGAVTDAAAAQSTADGAVTDAAAAQSTADGAVTAAATAQSTADGAATAAAAAQSTADTHINNADIHVTTGDKSIWNASEQNARDYTDSEIILFEHKSKFGEPFDSLKTGIFISNQTEFDSIATTVNSLIQTYIDEERTDNYKINVFIRGGVYKFSSSQEISRPTLTELDIEIKITACDGEKVYIISDGKEFSPDDAIDDTDTHYICPITNFDFRSNFVDQDFNIVKVQNTGDLSPVGINLAKSIPVVVDPEANLIKIEIPEELNFLKSKTTEYFNDCFCLMTSQWELVMGRDIYSDDTFIYFNYSSYNDTLEAGHFDEVYSKKTRFYITNCIDSILNLKNDKIFVSGGQIFIPKTITKLFVCEHTNLFGFYRLKFSKIEISGINFSGNTFVYDNGVKPFYYADTFLIDFYDCSNVFIDNNKFINNLSPCILARGSTSGYEEENEIHGSENINFKRNYCENNGTGVFTCAVVNGVVVECNRFKNSGFIYNQSAVFVRAKNVLISKNIFENNNCAIVLSGTIINFATYVSAIVEYNEIFNSNEYNSDIIIHGLIDQGAIYQLGTNEGGTIIRHNIIHDVSGYAAYHGIYYDHGASNITAEGNLIYRIYDSYTINSRYVETQTGAAQDTNTNNFLRNNILLGPVKFDGNTEVPNLVYIEDNIISSKYASKSGVAHSFKNSSIIGDLIKDNSLFIERDKIYVSGIPFELDPFISNRVIETDTHFDLFFENKLASKRDITSLSFNGIDSIINLGSTGIDNLTGTQDWTITTYQKINFSALTYQFTCNFGQNLQIWFAGTSSNRLAFVIYTSTDTYKTVFVPEAQSQGWVKLVGTYEASTQTMSLWANGAYVGSNSIVDPTYVAGLTNSFGNTTWKLDGSIASCAVYNRKLSASEIQALKGKDVISGVNLIHYWDFEEGTGALLEDKIGTVDGTITNATWQGVSDISHDHDGAIVTAQSTADSAATAAAAAQSTADGAVTDAAAAQSTADGKISKILSIRNEASTFTVDDSDNQKLIRYTGATNIDLSIDNTLSTGIVISIRQAGDGIITLISGSGTPTINGDLTTNGKYSVIQIIKIEDGIFDTIAGVEAIGEGGDIYISDILDWPAQGFSLSDHDHDGAIVTAQSTADGAATAAAAAQSTADGAVTAAATAQSTADTHIADSDVHVSTQDRTNLNNLDSLGAEDISLTQSIPFDKQLSVITATQTTDLVFTPYLTGAVNGYRTRVTLTGDSTHSISFSGFKKSGGSLTADNTKINSIIFWKEGDNYWYRIYELLTLGSEGGAPPITDNGQIFPGAVGFGTSSKGAYEGSATPTILICDSLDSGSFTTGTNRGTFRWCVDQAFPRIILFEVSGVIDVTNVTWRIKIDQPYMSIYGQSAPGKGITLRGTIFFVEASHILVQHLRLLPGEDSTLIGGIDIDACDIYNGQTSIVFDHCTFGWSVDELCGPQESTNITFSYCLFKEPLDRSTHYEESGGVFWAERHPYSCLTESTNCTFFKNIFYASYGRNPLVRQGNNQIINNYIYATRWAPPMMAGTVLMNVDCFGNHIELINSTEWSTHDKAVYVVDTMNASTQLYVADNICKYLIDNPGASQWDAVYNNSYLTQSMSELNNSSAFDILPANQVKSHLLQYAGAFWWNRDNSDADAIARITNATGRLRHSAYNYPATARNLEGTATSGNMESGHNWSTGNQTLVLSHNTTDGGSVVGPYTYTLTANCTTKQQVIDHINSLLPAALYCEAIGDGTFQECSQVCIRTTHAGDGSFIEVHSSGTGHGTLGIPAGEFYGQAVVSWDTASDSHSLSIPGTPHADGDANGYTDLEEWVYEMAYPSGSGDPEPAKWLGTLAAMDVWTGTQAQYDALGSYDSGTLYLIETT